MNTNSVAVIAAAGNGTRMHPITKVIDKPMLPLANLPAIHYVVEECIQFGARDIIIVTKPESEQIAEYFKIPDVLKELQRSTSNTKISVQCVPQRPDLGYGSAVPLLAAARHIEDRPTLYTSGDDILLGRTRSWSEGALGSSAMLAVRVPGDQAHKYGVIETADGYVRSIVEKPANFRGKTALINCSRYYFKTSRLVTLAEALAPSRNGELQITDLVAAIAAEHPFKAVSSEAEYLDVGTPKSYVRSVALMAKGRYGILD